jgi:hypothetical protein
MADAILDACEAGTEGARHGNSIDAA